MSYSWVPFTKGKNPSFQLTVPPTPASSPYCSDKRTTPAKLGCCSL